jgi:hypothetical protein
LLFFLRILLVLRVGGICITRIRGVYAIVALAVGIRVRIIDLDIAVVLVAVLRLATLRRRAVVAATALPLLADLRRRLVRLSGLRSLQTLFELLGNLTNFLQARVDGYPIVRSTVS